MAEEKKDISFVSELAPTELSAICELCHIANNKRMTTRLECASIQVEGQYCKLIESIRKRFNRQQAILDKLLKYVVAFMQERTVYRRVELQRLYNDNIVNGERSFDEFLNVCRYLGIEVIGD